MSSAGPEVDLVVYEREAHQLLLHCVGYVDAIAGWFDRHQRP